MERDWMARQQELERIARMFNALRTSTAEDPIRDAAAAYFDVPYDEVTEEQRAFAKTATFAERYGVGEEEIKRILGRLKR